jgi:hypothetical protein
MSLPASWINVTPKFLVILALYLRLTCMPLNDEFCGFDEFGPVLSFAKPHSTAHPCKYLSYLQQFIPLSYCEAIRSVCCVHPLLKSARCAYQLMDHYVLQRHEVSMRHISAYFTNSTNSIRFRFTVVFRPVPGFAPSIEPYRNTQSIYLKRFHDR